MAAQQAALHAKGRLGQRIAHERVGGEPTTHKAPFDLVDFGAGIAWEVPASRCSSCSPHWTGRTASSCCSTSGSTTPWPLAMSCSAT